MIKLKYENPTKKSDWDFLAAQIMWYTILPMAYTYAAIKFHIIFLIFVIPCLIFRLKKK